MNCSVDFNNMSFLLHRKPIRADTMYHKVVGHNETRPMMLELLSNSIGLPSYDILSFAARLLLMDPKYESVEFDFVRQLVLDF
jgi:hypothetical protein